MSNFNELFQQASFERLTQLDEIIALGSSVSNESKVMTFIDSSKSKFYDYVERVHHFIKSLSFGAQIAKHIDATEMIKLYGAQDYSKNRTMNFEVAAGFSGSLIDFLKLVTDHLLPAGEAIENTLKITNTRLAQILNEPDRMKAQSGIRELEHHLVLVKAEDLEKVKGFFKSGAKSQVKVMDVMSRNADMAEVYRLTNVWNARLSKVDFKRAQELVGRVGELTGHLNKQLNDSEDGNEVSGLTASQMSDLFYRLGITVTACSVLIEMGRQHSEAMQRNVDGVIAQLPKPMRDAVLDTGCQSTKVRILADKYPSDVTPLLKRMAAMKEITDRHKTSNQAIRIYDNLCESWYLSDVDDDKAALVQFKSDVAQAERDLKAIAA